VIITSIASLLALLSFLLAAWSRRRQYAYAGVVGCLVFAMIGALALAGCGGGSSSSGGGGGGSARTINATYSGDSNYAGSSGSATVTVH
jgi:hypothetical protein